MNTIGGYRGGSPLFETSYETWEFLFDLKALPEYNLVKADFSQWVTPDAIADEILFLAPDTAWTVTGERIPVCVGAKRINARF